EVKEHHNKGDGPCQRQPAIACHFECHAHNLLLLKACAYHVSRNTHTLKPSDNRLHLCGSHLLSSSSLVCLTSLITYRHLLYTQNRFCIIPNSRDSGRGILNSQSSAG